MKKFKPSEALAFDLDREANLKRLVTTTNKTYFRNFYGVPIIKETDFKVQTPDGVWHSKKRFKNLVAPKYLNGSKT